MLPVGVIEVDPRRVAVSRTRLISWAVALIVLTGVVAAVALAPVPPARRPIPKSADPPGGIDPIVAVIYTIMFSGSLPIIPYLVRTFIPIIEWAYGWLSPLWVDQP